MKFYQHLLTNIALLCVVHSYSQQYFDIKIPGDNYYKKCEKCLTLINNKPKEVLYGIQRDDQDNLYLVVTRKEWFDLLMNKSGDGVAIDIVRKEKYDCNKKISSIKSTIKGDLQKPMYLKELKQNMLPSQHGEVIIKMGMVPKKYQGKDIEFNIVFIKNKNLCYYTQIYNLKTYRWDLLDMGFYFDTLTYKSDFNSNLKAQEGTLLQKKVMKFEIPFEKNKSEYSAADIKPMYDSLRLTDFNITKINIRTYSSVEGNEERNNHATRASYEYCSGITIVSATFHCY